MKRNVLLVTNSNNGLSSVVAVAARQTGRGLKEANSARRSFEILKLGLDDVDIAVVGIDASLHSLAILEALSYWQTAPPVIALIDVDETEATHIVQRHGAAACLKKPFGPDELARLMDKICASACQNKPLTCDKWGHVRAAAMGEPLRSLTPAVFAH
jgi:DNA-binding response OmpR family regulator